MVVSLATLVSYSSVIFVENMKLEIIPVSSAPALCDSRQSYRHHVIFLLNLLVGLFVPLSCMERTCFILALKESSNFYLKYFHSQLCSSTNIMLQLKHLSYFFSLHLSDIITLGGGQYSYLSTDFCAL